MEDACLRVANGSANFRIGRPIAPHPSLCQPRRADAQKIGCILWGQQALIGANVLLRHGALMMRPRETGLLNAASFAGRAVPNAQAMSRWPREGSRRPRPASVRVMAK